MGLLADALAQRVENGERCAFARAVSQLSEEDAADLEAYITAIRKYRTENGLRAFGGPNLTELHRALRQIGVRVGQDMLGHHVAGRCICGQDR